MKQNKVLNGDPKPEYKKTTNRTGMGPILDNWVCSFNCWIMKIQISKYFQKLVK